MTDNSLVGRVAVVTGGTSGIGLGTARLLAERGATVHAVGLGAASVEAIPGVTVSELDVTDGDAVTAFFAGLDSLDILVPAAGISLGEDEQDPVGFAAVIDVNLLAAHRCCHAARELLFQDGGSIVLIASMYSVFGSSVSPAYAASKGGIVQLTKSLCQTYAPHGVRVNAVAPGWIETPLLEKTRDVAPEVYAGLLDRTPLNRIGQVDDIGRAIAFLAGPDAAFITGAVLPVDGGYLTV
ncbi:SDR family NAD(P)-dependent oxidoreductase [Gordonia hydrophobica]|uniref:SDR family oxidoreductase n=1 Tax=Gordonia hydrophobica TaxID=40516 RepID=A0ABZ2TXB2_9ACTN|nr:SDR family oxidoreductase [Gordonia hydrophobica]MBM7365808.1 NAD(P)-dependent dehydrogenase (short-subunit alcohol dehydrogenase family) [Gordonia hydrophobica]